MKKTARDLYLEDMLVERIVFPAPSTHPPQTWDQKLWFELYKIKIGQQ